MADHKNRTARGAAVRVVASGKWVVVSNGKARTHTVSKSSAKLIKNIVKEHSSALSRLANR